MRFILAVPLLAVVMVIYTALAIDPNFSAGSAFMDWVLPSGAELFLTFGDVIVIAGLVALFFEVIKSARLGAGTVIEGPAIRRRSAASTPPRRSTRSP